MVIACSSYIAIAATIYTTRAGSILYRWLRIVACLLLLITHANISFFWLSPSSLLHVGEVGEVGGADDCIDEHCHRTRLIPATENQNITFKPCDQCTNCTTSEPNQTVQAWWYYFYPNGSRTDDIRANVTKNKRNYMISVRCKGPLTNRFVSCLTSL